MAALGGDVERVAAAQFGPVLGRADLGDAGIRAQAQAAGSGAFETEVVFDEFDADRCAVRPCSGRRPEAMGRGRPP
jgi:hypothetical protein